MFSFILDIGCNFFNTYDTTFEETIGMILSLQNNDNKYEYLMLLFESSYFKRWILNNY